MVIEILESTQYDPAVNLAIEEYLFQTENYDSKMILYLWQNNKSVIIGKNQNIYSECKINYANDNDIRIVRRMTGGGAVYHDMGNLNVSFLYRNSNFANEEAMGVLINALNSIGVCAFLSGRNDITVEGRKIAGMASRESGNVVCLHGCIMVNVDKKHMYEVLNVNKDKYISKGIKSVYSRTINLKEIIEEVNIKDLKNAIIEILKDKYKNIEFVKYNEMYKSSLFNMLKEKYKSTEWNMRDDSQNISIRKRFEWGDCSIEIAIKNGELTKIKMYSDTLDDEVINRTEELLKASPVSLDGLKKIKESQDNNIIMNDIISMIIEEYLNNK